MNTDKTQPLPPGYTPDDKQAIDDLQKQFLAMADKEKPIVFMSAVLSAYLNFARRHHIEMQAVEHLAQTALPILLSAAIGAGLNAQTSAPASKAVH